MSATIPHRDNAGARLWYLYVLRCNDDSLYCGITTDLERRSFEHRSGKGSKYVRSRRPFTLIYSKAVGNHSAALKAEFQFKKLSREEKLEYTNGKDKEGTEA